MKKDAKILYEQDINAKEEAINLLMELKTTPNHKVCNHGRKTFFEISLEEMDKIFKR